MKTAIDEAKCRHSVLRPVKVPQLSSFKCALSVCGEEPTESVWKVFGPIGFISAQRFTVLWLLAAHGKTFHVLVLM